MLLFRGVPSFLCPFYAGTTSADQKGQKVEQGRDQMSLLTLAVPRSLGPAATDPVKSPLNDLYEGYLLPDR